MSPEFAFPTWVDDEAACVTWHWHVYEDLAARMEKQNGFQWFYQGWGSSCWTSGGRPDGQGDGWLQGYFKASDRKLAA